MNLILPTEAKRIVFLSETYEGSASEKRIADEVDFPFGPEGSALLRLLFDLGFPGYPAMAAIPSIIPISELRQDTAGVIKKTRATQEPVFITQRGRATAVLVSGDSYERTQYELGMLRAIARGEAEAAAGKGVSLETVRQIREVIVSPYRFFYRQRDKTVWILAVWHEAQLPDNPSE